jgi:CRISPR/Cas system CMR-associated protein Cmr5 small subunit
MYVMYVRATFVVQILLRPQKYTNNWDAVLHTAYFQGGVRKISEKEYESITDISHPKDPLSFIDLQNFLLKEMQMQANYQPIMIKTILLSGGKATRDYIAAKIKELNSKDQDFKNIPVYEVLKGHGIVREYGNEFVLNVASLTREQVSQLIALCNWKILNLPLQLEELIEAFNNNKSLFDPDYITLEERDKLRSSFVSDFLIDKIPGMKLDDYVEGKPDPQSNKVNKTTFCYRLERELSVLSGIGGIPNQKFGIYFNQKKQEYDYNKKKYESPETAFQAIRSEIYTILEAGKHFKEDSNWDKLSEILERDSNIYKIVKSKILSIYYPEDFIQIHSVDKLHVILEAFGKATNDIQDKLFLMQARLLTVKNEHPIMKEWHNEEFSHFVWNAIIERELNNKKFEKPYEISNGRSTFVTAYDDTNLKISKEAKMIGWKNRPSKISMGDYVFVFNTTTDEIESCFEIKSLSTSTDPIWHEEIC